MTRLRQKLNEDERCSNPKIWKNSQEAKKIAAQVKFLQLLPLELDQFVAKVFRFRYTRCYETDEEMPGFSAKMDELCSIMPGGKEGLVTFELVSANAPFFNQMLECMFPAGNFSHVIDELREKEEIENAPQAAHEMEEQRCLNVAAGLENACDLYRERVLIRNEPDFEIDSFKSAILGSFCRILETGDLERISRDSLADKGYLENLDLLFKGQDSENPSDAFEEYMEALIPGFAEKLPDLKEAFRIEADVPGIFSFF